MPSKSKAQYRMMQIASYNKDFADKRKIKQSAAVEWHEADKKKRAEDPEWFRNLPDHTDDEAKDKELQQKIKESKERVKQKKEGKDTKDIHKEKGEESHEGLSDMISKLFSSNKPEAAIKQEESFSPFKLLQDPDYPPADKVKGGTIEIKGLSRELWLKTWNDNWLSAVEKAVGELHSAMEKYLAERNQKSQTLKAIYTKCETLSPKEALAYAKPQTDKIYAQLDKYKFPVFSALAISIVPKTEHGFKVERGNPATGGFAVPALTAAGIRKVLKLMDTVADVIYAYDASEYDEWCLDDTDEHKWWAHHHPDDEDYWVPLLNLFPYAGETAPYDVDSQVKPIAQAIWKGLEGIVKKSLK